MATKKKQIAKKKPSTKKAAKKASKKKASKKKASKKKATQKTKPTSVSVSGFLDKLDATRRADANVLVGMMQKLTGEKARMWGPSIVGFGTYHYKYESGYEGDTALAAFSPRSPAFVVYLWPELYSDPLMAQLGKFTHGKSCLYVKKLADVNVAVLEKLVAMSINMARARFAA